MWTLSCSMWDLVPWPGIEPGPLLWELGVLVAKTLGSPCFLKSGSSPRWGGHLKMLWRAQSLPVLLLHSPLHVALILIVSRCSCISAWLKEERRAWGLKERSSWVPPYLPSQKSCPDLHLCLGLQLQGSLERLFCFVFYFVFACTGSSLLHGLSLVAATGGYSRAAWASHCSGFSCYRAQV